MDATMLAVLGTGLTAIGTGVALFAALWKVQGNRFDTLERHMDKRFEAVDERVDRALRDGRKRKPRTPGGDGPAVDGTLRGDGPAVRDGGTARRGGPRGHLREHREGWTRGPAPTPWPHQRFDALNGRFDDLYRHLLGASPQSPPPGAAPAGVLAANAPTSTHIGLYLDPPDNALVRPVGTARRAPQASSRA